MISECTLHSDGSMTLSINFKPVGSMHEQEEQIADALNSVGLLATLKSLESFDTDCSVLVISNQLYRSRQEKKSIKRPMAR